MEGNLFPLLRAICSDTVYDIPSGSIYGKYILIFYLTFFLALYLTYILPFCLFGSRRAPQPPERVIWLSGPGILISRHGTQVEPHSTASTAGEEEEKERRREGEEEGEEGEEEEEEEEEEGGVAPLLKSRNLHLAGGEKELKIEVLFFFQMYCFDLFCGGLGVQEIDIMCSIFKAIICRGGKRTC